MQFVDPKNDLAFKKIFGDDRHKSILISFLNSVLDFKGQQTIVDVTLANPYQVPKIPELKETILDIKATNQKNEEFIVEMQKKDLGDFSKRSLYYTSKAYIAQLPKGNNYSELKRVYFIGLLNFNIFENESYISRHLIINQETQTQDLEDFEFSFIELPKFNKSLEELESVLDKWIFFIKNANDLTMIPQTYQTTKPFKEAFDIATQTTWSTKELEVYEYMALKEFDEINALKTAERKGEERGKIEGKIEGEIEGEKKKAYEIVKKMILSGMDNDTISTLTELSIEEIEKIRDEKK